jgi:threonine dehydratase
VRICLDLGVENLLITEDDIKEGFRFMYGRMKLACEAAGAATAAALLAGKVPLESGETVVAVVSGGNVAPQTAAAILAER